MQNVPTVQKEHFQQQWALLRCLIANHVQQEHIHLQKVHQNVNHVQQEHSIQTQDQRQKMLVEIVQQVFIH